jgi:hypothetical protein
MKKVILTIAVFSFISLISCKEKTQGQTKSSIEERGQNNDRIERSKKETETDYQLNKESKQSAESVEMSTLKNITNADNNLENSINSIEVKTVFFEGIKVGDTFIDHSDKFKRENEESDESTFKGYQIMDKYAKVIGFAFANSSDKSKIDKIEITTPNYKTNEGIGIGNTFEEVNKTYSNIKLVRNKNSVTAHNYKFIFNNDNISSSSKIKKITIEK